MKNVHSLHQSSEKEPFIVVGVAGLSAEKPYILQLIYFTYILTR